MDAKGIFASKTFWLNVVIVALVAFQALDGVAWIDPKAQAAIVAVLNVIMRLLTNQPIELPKGGGKVALALALCLALSACSYFSKSGYIG